MTNDKKISVVVLIDALGWTYLQGRTFLDKYLPHRNPARTILGFSSGAIPTILTGQLPAVTGHWNLLYYDPKGSAFKWARALRILPQRFLDHRITRRVLTEIGRKILRLGPSFECCVSPRLLPWFNWVEKKNIYGTAAIAGRASVFDQLSADRIPYRVYSYRDCSDQEILRRAEADIRNSDAGFFFVYLSEMDMFLHLHCSEPQRVAQKMRWYEERISKIFDAALEIDPEAHFTVISDHGMAPITNQYDVIGELEPLNLSMPGDYLAVFDSTMVRFWFFNDRSRQLVTEKFGGLPCGRWLADEELKQEGVFFPDRRFGERIFLLRPGWILSRSDFNGAGWSPAGMHGYHPDDPYSDAVFLTNYAAARPARTIVDFYAHMQESIQHSSALEAPTFKQPETSVVLS